jgi:hypothetical protein
MILVMGDGLIHALINIDNSLNPKQGDSARSGTPRRPRLPETGRRSNLQFTSVYVTRPVSRPAESAPQ